MHSVAGLPTCNEDYSGEDRANDTRWQGRRRDPDRKAICLTDRQQAGRRASAAGRAAKRPRVCLSRESIPGRFRPYRGFQPSRQNPGSPHRHDRHTVNADSFVITLRRLTA